MRHLAKSFPRKSFTSFVSCHVIQLISRPSNRLFADMALKSSRPAGRPCQMKNGSLCSRFFSSLDLSFSLPVLTDDSSREIEYDWEYITNPSNREEIKLNINNRKGIGNIDLVQELWQKFEKFQLDGIEREEPRYKSLRHALVQAASDLPNRSHPNVPVGDETKAEQVSLYGKKKDFSYKVKPAVDLAEEMGLIRTEAVGLGTGPRTYYLKNDLARMEQALVGYTLDNLLSKGFSLISVPDLVSSDVIEGCGFKTTGQRTQIFKLKRAKHGDVCLAGTGEIPIAGFFKDMLLDLTDLPKRLCTVSRCYRAEAAEVEKERGLYRVHQFMKVEMFGVTANETGQESDRLLREILDVQRQLFEGLNLHFRILNMPSQELGAAAYQKYDMETWLPAKEFWGEISSASNCTDYQSRRLRIKYGDGVGNVKHCHTVNGTGCAVPRILISILENNQQQDGSVRVPESLRPYMDDVDLICKRKSLDRLTPIRRYHYTSKELSNEKYK